jgi:hypothetical protein
MVPFGVPWGTSFKTKRLARAWLGWPWMGLVGVGRLSHRNSWLFRQTYWCWAGVPGRGESHGGRRPRILPRKWASLDWATPRMRGQ